MATDRSKGTWPETGAVEQRNRRREPRTRVLRDTGTRGHRLAKAYKWTKKVKAD